ncbi:hypothetical protein HZ326_11079 [Fusarium oxysporum f. sp. albedinis]|nr:hypothetical protein HZ326_11079 [Fusarium oxysporum f. sp. albedinis]
MTAFGRAAACYIMNPKEFRKALDCIFCTAWAVIQDHYDGDKDYPTMGGYYLQNSVYVRWDCSRTTVFDDNTYLP